jgi:hypothetical protein
LTALVGEKVLRCEENYTLQERLGAELGMQYGKKEESKHLDARQKQAQPCPKASLSKCLNWAWHMLGSNGH